MIIRNVEWHVSTEPTDTAVIGRPLLDAIGCSNEEMLAAACDPNNGVIAFSELALDEDPSSKRTVASLLTDA